MAMHGQGNQKLRSSRLTQLGFYYGVRLLVVFLLNGSSRFWIHGLKVWIYMSSGFWVLDSGWVVGLGLFGRIWAIDFGFEVGLVIIGVRSS